MEMEKWALAPITWETKDGPPPPLNRESEEDLKCEKKKKFNGLARPALCAFQLVRHSLPLREEPMVKCN